LTRGFGRKSEGPGLKPLVLLSLSSGLKAAAPSGIELRSMWNAPGAGVFASHPSASPMDAPRRSRRGVGHPDLL